MSFSKTFVCSTILRGYTSQSYSEKSLVDLSGIPFYHLLTGISVVLVNIIFKPTKDFVNAKRILIGLKIIMIKLTMIL